MAAIRVVADLDKCCGYANCVAAAPEYFGLDEETNKVVIKQSDFDKPPLSLYQAVRSCPAHALSVISVRSESAA